MHSWFWQTPCNNPLDQKCQHFPCICCSKFACTTDSGRGRHDFWRCCVLAPTQKGFMPWNLYFALIFGVAAFWLLPPKVFMPWNIFSAMNFKIPNIPSIQNIPPPTLNTKMYIHKYTTVQNIRFNFRKICSTCVIAFSQTIGKSRNKIETIWYIGHTFSPIFRFFWVPYWHK